jgi:cytochrome c biogenesis protein
MTTTARQERDATPGIPPEEPVRPPGLGAVELARWAWRQLTSMRTALLLLFLLALGAVPGSVVPQRGVAPGGVLAFTRENPRLAEWFERLSLFDVYSAPWFAAIYLLLFTSLVGCLVPRSRLHWRSMRTPPPPTPRNLARMPVHERWDTDVRPQDVHSAAAVLLRQRRFRTRTDATSVAAEKGYLRELGNLVFHMALVLLLFGVAIGSFFGWRGGVLLIEGEGFSNVVTEYDNLERGPGADLLAAAPFTLRLDDFTVAYEESGPQLGSPREFTATTTLTPRPGAQPQQQVLRVNDPLRVEGVKVFLIGNGYAPEVTVRDGRGEVAYAGPVAFLPQDSAMTSTGVVKVQGALPEQLGFEGIFLPTWSLDPRLGPVSVFPDARDPQLFLTAYRGDLDGEGVPQSVFTLDTERLEQFTREDGQPLAAALAPGETFELPDGAGSLTFDGLRRWTSLSVSHDPGKEVALAAALLAIGGLMLSLFVRHRRVWVRASAGAGGRTVVEVAGLGRTEAEGLRDEVSALAERLRRDAASAPPGVRTSAGRDEREEQV